MTTSMMISTTTSTTTKRIGATAALALMALALAGCAGLQHGGDAPEAVGTWFSPPAEYPGICMTLESSGQVQFEGGFTYFNPGRWAYNRDEAELHITLGGSKPFPLDVVKDQMTRNPGGLVRYDAAGRELVYSVTPLTQTIGLGGFVFFRKLPCAPAAKQP